MHIDVSGIREGNCLPLDSTSVLSISSKKEKLQTDIFDHQIIRKYGIELDQCILSEHHYDTPIVPT